MKTKEFIEKVEKRMYMMKELTLKEKMELYDDLVREEEIIEGRILKCLSILRIVVDMVVVVILFTIWLKYMTQDTTIQDTTMAFIKITGTN